MSEFKVGDKVRLDPTKIWTMADSIRIAKDGIVGKIVRGSDRAGYYGAEFPYEGGVRKYDERGRFFLLAEPSSLPTGGPLADTLKTIDDKIKAAVARNEEINAERRAERQKIEDAQATGAKRIRKLKAEQRKLDKVIIQYGNQITKLRELEQEETETPNIQVGDTVTVIGESYTGQYGTVEEVRPTDDGNFSIKVYGGFVTANGYKIPEVLFAVRELQVVAR